MANEGGIGNKIGGAFGTKGFKYIADTNAHTGNYFCLDILTDTVFTAIVGNYEGTITGVTFTAGTKLYGFFTSLTLTSGTLNAYKSDES